jgi:hypothetical protein
MHGWIVMIEVLYQKLAPTAFIPVPHDKSSGAVCCEKDDRSTARDCLLCSAPTCIHCRGLLNGRWICAPCRDDIKAQLEWESRTLSDFPRAFVGGLAISIISAAFWFGITVATGYLFSIANIIVGIASGFGVHASSQGKRGLTIQCAAMLSAMLAILLWRFAIGVYVYNLGVNSAAQISVFDLRTIALFFGNLTTYLTPFDLIFMLLAAGVAFMVPRQRVVAIR